MTQQNNRGGSERRARNGATSPAPSAGIDELLALATDRRRSGDIKQAMRLCQQALARSPKHTGGLMMFGELLQQDGRAAAAVRVLKQVLSAEPGLAPAHETIALAYQALGREIEAQAHFTRAISLGLVGMETLLKQSPAMMGMLGRFASAWPRQLPLDELLAESTSGSFAGDALLLALLKSRPICDFELERFLTAFRRALLQFVFDGIAAGFDNDALPPACALAQQCFINEYVFAFGQAERTQSHELRDRIVGGLETGAAIEPLHLAAAACYLPLYELPQAGKLLDRSWPDALETVLTQQLREPRQEMADLAAIPVLTPVDDDVSQQVRRQYEENPYPRWTTRPPVQPATVDQYLGAHLQVAAPQLSGFPANPEILVAGCGTGHHSVETAQRFPSAPVLAIDISRSSLAYARRKSREAGIGNVEYAQADILRLAGLSRRFDIIETVGVLHHLADPLQGWRALLSLLRPGGLMLVGLYSAIARRPINAARAMVVERGYRATADDIRACRQELIYRGLAVPSSDFFSTSGCRDLYFNVMEHQLTIPQIEAFLAEQQLVFLGFELTPDVRTQFQGLFPDPLAITSLARWAEFEELHPRTFIQMYNFWVRKPG